MAELHFKQIRDTGAGFENWDSGYLDMWSRVGVGAQPLPVLKAYLAEETDISRIQFDFNKGYAESPNDFAVLAQRGDVAARQVARLRLLLEPRF